MTIKRIALIIGKIILGGLAFYAGIILGSVLAGLLGLAMPSLPAGADVATLGQYQLIISLLFAATLAFVSRGLASGFLARWLILVFFSWVSYALNTYLEAAIFTSDGAASAYTLVMQLVAILLCATVVAGLFRPEEPGASFKIRFEAFVGQYRLQRWAWMFLLCLLAFPLAYVVFGLLVEPFVIEFYEQQLASLAAPGWGEIIPVLLLRSLLFLLACLPVLIVWQKSRLQLLITLGSALFILVGGLYMLQSYWFPVIMRVAHSLEILADSFVYAGVLVLLLTKGERRPVQPEEATRVKEQLGTVLRRP